MKYIKITTIVFTLSFILSSCSSTFSHSRLAFLGTNLTTFSSGKEMKNYINYASNGEGNFTVVLENDIGEEMDSWDEIFDDIADNSKVFAYNRPGYDGSTNLSSPRDPEQIANELRKVLKITKMKPPFILVGHGIGGYYTLSYVEHYPKEVAGIILIETPNPKFLGLCDEKGVKGCDRFASIENQLPFHVKKEYLASKEFFLPNDIGNIPLAIVSRTPTISLSKSKELRTLWFETQRDLTLLSTDSKHFIAKHAGRYVQTDEPKTVLDAIKWIKSEYTKKHNQKYK